MNFLPVFILFHRNFVEGYLRCGTSKNSFYQKLDPKKYLKLRMYREKEIFN